ncbi:MAG TPA: (Fe-S)-binding protein [Myxococcota bacterium]|nr:(Fe-S)-binding protein [Myxococcota bacterium]
MRVALFVPCYVDQLFPRVAWASVAVLERLGCQVAFDPAQACCGQPLLTAGHPEAARPLARRFLDVFASAEHVVAPSASCVAAVRRHYAHLCPGDPRTDALGRVRELCEFAVDVLGVERLPGRYPHRVGLHPSCHGLRELRLGTGSERAVAYRDPARALLGSLDGIALVEPARRDECCGFGGTFAVTESAVSGMMGRDRVRAYVEAGAEYITATDVSCLAHLDGVARRTGVPVRVAHVAEILAEAGE